MKKHLKIFGYSSYEFPASVLLLISSFFILLPPQARESYRFLPTFYYENQAAAKVSALLVVMLVGLFCSLNAYFHARISRAQKNFLMIWSLVLLIFMGGSIFYLAKWWFILPPSLKP